MIATVFAIPRSVPVSGFKVVRGVDLRITVDEGELREAERKRKLPDGSLEFTRRERVPEWVLIVNNDPGTPSGVRPAVSLRADATDFLEFIKLAPGDPSGVIEFADRYGFLTAASGLSVGPRKFLTTADPTADPPAPPGIVMGEDVADWWEAAESMRPAVTVWKLTRERDAEGLKRYFRRSEEGWFFVPPGNPRRPVEPVSGRGEVDDIEDVASRWLRIRANQMITSVQPRIVRDDERGNVVALVPLWLKAALWLQFAFAVCGEQEYRECEACGKTFGFDRHNRVSGRKRFCSPSCRVKGSRQRAAEFAPKLGARKARKGTKKTTKKGEV